MAHKRVSDVGEPLLVQSVFLDGIIDKVERCMANEVGGSWIAGKEGESGLPGGAVGSKLV